MTISSRNVLTFIVVAYAVVLAPLVDAEMRNYLVLVAGMVGFLAIGVYRLRITPQVRLGVVLLILMSFSILAVDSFGGLGTVALSAVYASGYFAVSGLLDRIRDKGDYVRSILGKLIVAFAIVSVIQMATSLVGLPVPNELATKGLWSYNSLSMEPSQLGRVVGITMLSYLIVARPLGRREPIGTVFLRERRAIISFLTTMLLSGSATAAVAIPITFTLSRSLRWGIVLAGVALVAMPLIPLIDYEPLQRTVRLVSNLGSSDASTLFEADSSGASRIYPLLLYLQDSSSSEVGFWLGYGIDGPSRFLLGRLPGYGDIVQAGFLPGYMIIYGMILTSLFMLVFVFYEINRSTAPVIIFWLLFMTSSAINTQVLWYGLVTIRLVAAVHRESMIRRAKAMP